MKYTIRAIRAIAVLFAFLVGSGCQEVSGPLRPTEVVQMAASNTGAVALVAGAPDKPPHIWLRTEFKQQESRRLWRPLCALRAPHKDLRVLWASSRPLVLREVAGRSDLYDAQEGTQLTRLGDITDATCIKGALVVLRPLGKRTSVGLLAQNGKLTHLMARHDVVTATLGAHELAGLPPTLYWAEGDAIMRMALTPALKPKLRPVQIAQAEGPIASCPIAASLRPEHGEQVAWLERHTAELRAQWRLTSGKTITGQDQSQAVNGVGAISENGRWACLWNVRDQTLTRIELKE